MSDTPDLQARLDRLRRPEPRPSIWKKMALPAGMLIAGAAAGAYIVTIEPKPKESKPTLPTSAVSEFQNDGGLEGFNIAISQPQPESVIREVPSPVSGQLQADLERTKEELEAARAALEQAKEAASNNPAMTELQEKISQLEEESRSRNEAYDELSRENIRLQTELEAKSIIGDQMPVGAVETDPRLAEYEQRRAQQEAEAEARRAAEREQLEARITSPMVAFRAGSDAPAGGGGGEGAGAAAGAGGEGMGRSRGRAEDFRLGAKKADATTAEVIGDPGRTILQGTLIEATLQTAVSTQIGGNVAATVSYDVWSMDMTNVLIPRGSKLFGRYSPEVEKGQRRVMVAWDRLVTPDGQSVELAAYGADRIGRSGMTGKVNTHTLTRFGAAAAISIIGAAPAVLAAAVEKDRDDEVSRETAEKLGEDTSETISKMMQDYIDIPATINVDQGSVVMVVVNADLEMF